MATDSIRGLTEQVLADLKTVDGQISGMEDQITGANTAELKAALEDPPLAELEERKSDLETLVEDLRKLADDIDAAEAHGWPGPQHFTLPDELMVQFLDQTRDLAAAAGLFKPPSTAEAATTLDVQFGEPLPKPGAASP